MIVQSLRPVNDKTRENSQARSFWNSYAKATGTKRKRFTVVRLADRDELADELATQVLAGTMRARTTLSRDFDRRVRQLPRPGDLSVVVDGRSAPRCIIRITEVETKPMREVDERFAWDAGGGDRTLAWWMSAHQRYFKRRGEREGFAVDPDTVVVLERFEVVWPLHLTNSSHEGGR